MSSSCEVSRDSQRLRHWTPAEPVDVPLIKVDRRLPLVVSPASSMKQIADRHSRPLHSRSQLPLVVSHPAEGRQTSCRPFPAFLSARSSRKTHRATSALSFTTANRRLGALRFSFSPGRSTTDFPSLARLEAHWLLPSVSLPSLGHSPSQSAGCGLLSGERKEEEEPLGPPPMYEQ